MAAKRRMDSSEDSRGSAGMVVGVDVLEEEVRARLNLKGRASMVGSVVARLREGRKEVLGLVGWLRELPLVVLKMELRRMEVMLFFVLSKVP